MPSSDKPRHRFRYTPEETEQVKAVCLTIAVTLGAYLDDLCIVGGLVPPLLIDTARTRSDEDDDLHPGTNDLDVGLALTLLDDERYAEISRRLRAEERVLVEIDGRTLKGEHARRIIPVCGPAGFVVLKALALGDRGEPKDAYDLVYVIRHTPGRATAIADRLAQHAENHPEIVARAIGLLARDFDTPDDIGPLRAAGFIAADNAELGNAAADAHGYVNDLVRAAVKLGLSA
jgi:Nucleotidyl transferase AbiEii toxin, Type IV TA system